MCPSREAGHRCRDQGNETYRVVYRQVEDRITLGQVMLFTAKVMPAGVMRWLITGQVHDIRQGRTLHY